MKILKVVGICLLGLLGLTVLLYLVGAAVNWRDRPPSAAALQMREMTANRAPVAYTENAFVYAMGFSVPATDDPQSAGARRTAWLESVNRDPDLFDADPVKDEVEFGALVSRSMEHMKELCVESHSAECHAAFLAASLQPRTTLEELQRTRYRALLQRPKWHEVVPLDLRLPLAKFGDIIGGQRLLFVELAARAKLAPPAENSERLRADHEFWCEVLKSADYLISKMIAVAALRQHYFFGNLVLREMPGSQTATVSSWSAPTSREALSMRRTMAGELAFGQGQMQQWLDGNDLNFSSDPDDPRFTFLGRMTSAFARPYYQQQDQMNFYAAKYLDFIERFEAPLDQYPEVAAAMERQEHDKIAFHIYNPVGHIFRSIAGTWSYADYPMRVGSIEGMRRAALLTVQLRDRGVPLEKMAEEVRSAGLRNPFDGQPFIWSANEHAVVYEGPDAEGNRYRHPYFY